MRVRRVSCACACAHARFRSSVRSFSMVERVFSAADVLSFSLPTCLSLTTPREKARTPNPVSPLPASFSKKEKEESEESDDQPLRQSTAHTHARTHTRTHAQTGRHTRTRPRTQTHTHTRMIMRRTKRTKRIGRRMRTTTRSRRKDITGGGGTTKGQMVSALSSWCQRSGQ